MDVNFEIALSVAEILIIKRDFDMLQLIVTHLKPELQLQIIPFTALMCHEAIEYLNKLGNPIIIEKTSRYSIKDIRQKSKFFDLGINKLLQSVSNIDYLQNDLFIQSMKYPENGNWNIHDNIGIWFDENGNIIGNTQYAYYVFQDEKMICKSFNDMSGHNLDGEEIRNFAFDMGRIIGSISYGLSSVGDFIKGDFSERSLGIHSMDFNTNRCNVNDSNLYKTIRLFLLHILSSIGFIIHVLKKCVIRDTGIMLRLEYITYHYALRRLEDIKNYIITNQKEVNDANLCKALEGIDYANSKGLLNTDFRNCMMHFRLKAKDSRSLIDESKFDLSLPLCGLVESQFLNLNYINYQMKIETELTSISTILNDYLNFAD